MKRSGHRFVKVGCAIIAGLVISQNHTLFAGWTGLITGKSVGYASVNVRPSTSLVTNFLVTLNNMTNPSAANPPVTGYKTNAPLPSGSSAATYARVKAFSGGILQGSAVPYNGDGADNPELQRRIKIKPADCASLNFESKIDQTDAEFAANGNSGTISVTAKGTAGTALWVRGFEFLGSMADVPADDPSTVDNEAIEYLKAHGEVAFEALIVGPFEFGDAAKGGCPLIIPFSLTSSNLEHLVYASDGVALSLPLVVVCPPNIVVGCDESFSYSPVQYAGCGDMTITYSPAPLAGPFPPGYFPVGVTPVTVTVADTNGNSTNCTFTVTVTDTAGPVPPVLPILTGESSVTVPQPEPATDNCGGVVTATTTDPLIYTNQGTFTVRWNFTDPSSNSTMASQMVIVDDKTSPLVPQLTTLTGQCSVTVPVPTTTDLVSGLIPGTTTDPLTYNSQGTFTVHWTFDDHNGNVVNANQTVIVKDTIAPAVPVLPVVTSDCGTPVNLIPPTTTDNCAGTVTGTTTGSLNFNNPGTNFVIWTFDDRNGNTCMATQTVIIAGLTFHGFYPPINGTGGSCSDPLRTVTLGNNVPLKFDITCGGLPYGGGVPTLSIERPVVQPCSTNLAIIGGGNFTPVNNEWHFNWDTTGQSKGTYRLTATLQDGSKQSVWIKIK